MSTILITYATLSFIASLLFYAVCVAAARADRHMRRSDKACPVLPVKEQSEDNP
jgi:hypothetical protein